MVLKSKKTWLTLCVLCLLALPAAGQEMEAPRLVSLTAVVEFVVDQIQNLVANIGPEMEPHGTPTEGNFTTTAEGDNGTATEEDDGLPNFGPGLEPHG